jgi:protoporphyrin/coproporphyrin ferrochelatase
MTGMATELDRGGAAPGCAPYDAVLLVCFGGPEKPEDVVPFLENVTRGKGIPRERLEEVGEHYFQLGGRSPLNDLNRAFRAAVEDDLRAHGIAMPVYWGNRNWDPFLREAVERMKADGVRRVACFLTSAYSSYSGCRQYRENLYDAVEGVDDAPRLDRLRHYFNHPGFVSSMVDATLTAIEELPAVQREGAIVLFVTHSIPLAMNHASGRGDGLPGGAYVRQHESVADLVATAVGERRGLAVRHELVYCSRSGPPQVPWLEPDVGDRIAELAEEGEQAVVVVPVGFIADHMEVIYDLDTEAREAARQADVGFARAATAGTDPRFVSVVRELLLERARVERGEPVGRPALGGLGPSWDVCPPGCCANPRQDRPALCGSD